MTKFAFYQAIHADGTRTNHGIPLGAASFVGELENFYASHHDDDVVCVVPLGTIECDRFIPTVMEKNRMIPTDADDASMAVTAIQLDSPITFSNKAKAVLKELEGYEACFLYLGHFIITDEGLDLLEDIRWEGTTLEEMERWLEQQAEMLILPEG